ncbi:MAG: DUF1302 domain-containing protein [Bermanella sp.]
MLNELFHSLSDLLLGVLKIRHLTPPLNQSLSVIVMFIIAAQAQSFEFYSGDIEGTFDSDISIGSSWRVENINDDLEVDNNVDDSDRNYSNGEAFSQIFKGSHSLSLNYENYGAFFRGKYWYDSALENNNVNHGSASTATLGGDNGNTVIHHGGRLDDANFNNLSKFSGAAMLDAFVYGAFDIIDMPLDIRLGRQVLSWGESTFIRGGINAINAIDVNAFTRAGAELKEGLLPTNMLFAGLGLSDSLSMEAFYLLDYQETVMPGCGTYFSPNDTIAQGCDLTTVKIYDTHLVRNADGIRRPASDGQFGFALRYIVEDWNDTELSLYWKTQHASTPNQSGTKSNLSAAALNAVGEGAMQQALAANPGLTQEQLGFVYLQGYGVAALSDATFFTEYVEDQELVGLSFSSTVGDVALSGEVSHHLDVPLQINSAQFILLLAKSDAIATSEGFGSTILSDEFDLVQSGGDLTGYRLFDTSQAQITAIKFIDGALGADQITLVGELAYTRVHGLAEGSNEIKYGGTGTGDAGSFDTPESSGINLQILADYSSLFWGVNLQPKISFSEGIEGNAPVVTTGFIEGEQSLSMAVDANYLSLYKATISYTQFWGGEFSRKGDRDYMTASVGVQF